MDNMEDYKLRKVIHDYVKEVCHYSQKQVFANSSYQKNYFQMQIDEATTGLIQFLQLYYNYNSKTPAFPAKGDQVVVEQYIDMGKVSLNNLSANPGSQQELGTNVPLDFQLGIEPNAVPNLQPGMEPNASPDLQPGIGSSIPPSVQQQLPPANQPENTAGTGSQREFTVQELSQYNGKNGNPAYVAVNGIVYDMSNVLRWAGGSHFGLNAGEDHTLDFAGCHFGMTERLQGLPVVGMLLPS